MNNIDDVIGTICHEHGTELNTGEPILILSGDGTGFGLRSKT